MTTWCPSCMPSSCRPSQYHANLTFEPSDEVQEGVSRALWGPNSKKSRLISKKSPRAGAQKVWKKSQTDFFESFPRLFGLFKTFPDFWGPGRDLSSDSFSCSVGGFRRIYHSIQSTTDITKPQKGGGKAERRSAKKHPETRRG